MPNIVSETTCFYLKHGGDLLVKSIGERQFSHDLNQGGMELSATYISRSTDLRSKLLILVGEVMEKHYKASNKERVH